jgi:hypothetical protein
VFVVKFFMPSRLRVTLIVLLTFCQIFPTVASAQSPVKLQNAQGAIDFSTEGTSVFDLQGSASHLGKFSAYGEVEFQPGAEAGSLLGDGVAVFKAANGDLLVGITTWDLDAEMNGEQTAHIHFSWRDSVQLSDGRTVASTGRFVTARPPGLVVIAIIAILIGLPYPVVVKCGPGGIGC